MLGLSNAINRLRNGKSAFVGSSDGWSSGVEKNPPHQVSKQPLLPTFIYYYQFIPLYFYFMSNFHLSVICPLYAFIVLSLFFQMKGLIRACMPMIVKSCCLELLKLISHLLCLIAYKDSSWTKSCSLPTPHQQHY